MNFTEKNSTIFVAEFIRIFTSELPHLFNLFQFAMVLLSAFMENFKREKIEQASATMNIIENLPSSNKQKVLDAL